MKLAPILAQYLYTNKRLDLPGIGSFLLDPSVIIDTESSRHGKNFHTEGISFINNAATKEVPELIQFISQNTGKMKALAAADLDSYLQLAQQFLNIGKPFLVEGIGSLVKSRSGQLTFIPGDILPDKLKEYSAREISSTSSSEESFAKSAVENIKWRRPLVIFFLLAGIGLAVWASYTIYKRATAGKNTENSDLSNTEGTILTDSSQFYKPTSNQPVQQQIPEGNYKFVVEVANKERGLFRFSALQSYGLDIKMETKDSMIYKLYFVLPALPSDTARLMDSLGLLYTPPGERGFVEK